MSDILTVSSSLSWEIYSLIALTNSSSSSNLRTGYFLMGDDSLIYEDLSPLNPLDSLNSSSLRFFLDGVLNETDLLLLNVLELLNPPAD